MQYLKNQITQYLIYNITISTAMYLTDYTKNSIIQFNIFVIFQFFTQQILILYLIKFKNISNSELQDIMIYIQIFTVILAMLTIGQLDV